MYCSLIEANYYFNFFCHNVENVIASNAIIVATNPTAGILDPISKT